MSENGFHYDKIESAKIQRIRRVAAVLESSGSISVGRIKRICGYSQHNAALDLAISFVDVYPELVCLNPVPKRLEYRFKAEIESGTLRKKAFKTEPIKLMIIR